MKKYLTKTFALLLLFCLTSFAQAQSVPTDRSLYFDGYDDYIMVLNSSSLDTTNTFHSPSLTIEAWIRICDINGSNTIVSKAYCNAGRYEYHFYVTNGKLAWQVYDDGDCANQTNRLTTKSPVISESTWHHVAVSHNGATEVVTLYVDGVAYHHDVITETETVGTIGHPLGGASEPVRIGLIRPAVGKPVGAFYGRMDDVMIFHEARVDSQIVADGVSGVAPSSSGNLKLYLDMDAPIMGRDKTIPNLGMSYYNCSTKNFENDSIGRVDQTPFTIYNDTEICCSAAGNLSRLAQPSEVTEKAPIAKGKLTISPNPNQGAFELHWPAGEGQSGQVKIYNIVTGQKVFEGLVRLGERIELASDPMGVYSVTVLTESGTFFSANTISGLK